MRIAALAGGVGSARFLSGLVRVVDPASCTVVVNTADDERIRGMHVSPDVDTVLYHLSGQADWERGWGLTSETWNAQEHYRALAAAVHNSDEAVDLQDWFQIGDRDLAVHMVRSRLLDLGWTLSMSIEAIARAMGVGARVLPMSDDSVRTVVVTRSGERLSFQDYFVRRSHQDDVAAVEIDGATAARPCTAALEALAEADVILIPPSNPILSIQPILSVPGFRAAIAESKGVRVGVSPIVAGRAVKGPADRLMASTGHDPSALGVARIYAGLLDLFLLDEADSSLAEAVRALGMEPVVCDTLMTSPDHAERVAKTALDASIAAGD